ncbi:MAG: transcription-repair coupling factor [bacterium]
MSDVSTTSAFSPILPEGARTRWQWGRCKGSAAGLAIAKAAELHSDLTLVVTRDLQHTAELESQLRFFLPDADISLLHFPDWETLPYDVFSPLPELVSDRLLALHQLRRTKQAVLIAPVATLMQKILPPGFLDSQSLIMEVGDTLALDTFRRTLESTGYHAVPQVLSHGEFCVRGSLLDLYPMGSSVPFRIDLFDDEIDSIRSFDPETQRTEEKLTRIEMLPAREFPTDEDAITRFRKNYRDRIEGDPQQSLVYRDVSEGIMPGGIEYYLPLFHDETATLFDYLDDNTLVIESGSVQDEAEHFFERVEDRYEQRRHDLERPLLPPTDLYLDAEAFRAAIKRYPGVQYHTGTLNDRSKGFTGYTNLNTEALPPLGINGRSATPAGLLQGYLDNTDNRVLFVAETAGRREALLETLRDYRISPTPLEDWQQFVAGQQMIAITVGRLEAGLQLPAEHISLVPESLLLGERVKQTRRKRKAGVSDQAIRNLAELQIGSPVVHEDHGVGRYLGLQSLDVGGMHQEFLTLEYAKGDKLYVPVASLHLISRYSGVADDSAPMHRLGGEQWEKLKRKAAEKVRDTAAELLDIYARRAARQGHAVSQPGEDYRQFSAEFEFEETPDQLNAIEDVIHDMTSPQPMDRVVCGDVGFGKTEVAMRAAFMAANSGKQVAVLVPTTLLAQQHFQNFADRFANWPIRIELLSRFRSQKETTGVLNGLREGKVDVVVGTHKLLGKDIQFKDLALVIIDEEHRFGVQHKERFKSMRAEVDILTLTATPIPRTLNMAMSGMRDLSIIASPPRQRHPIQTFISQWNDATIAEACLREINRGGQVYFLHNEVSTIAKTAEKISELVHGARVQFAHGQMRERELEAIMRDFYHQRFNILVCTTIVESGIDVPTANTIIINRADKLGLAQLHQLRGRVGRSHHRAYAYLVAPGPKQMTADARKRLEALESLEDLGAGFTLATHDLEIRGAGELLGEDQSGQIQEIGYTLYTEMLNQAVEAIKAGRQPELDRPLDHGTEVDLHVPALIPEDYLPDVHMRLIQYKRIASAESDQALRELKVEFIDRFGLLPTAVSNLFDVTAMKLRFQQYGIRKVDAGPAGGRIEFNDNPNIDPVHLIKLIQTDAKTFKMDGQSRMKFTADLADTEKRVQKVQQLLDRVVGI